MGTSEKNKGVSWSFLLRNAYIMLRLRKSPLQQLVGSIRFSAERLWTYGPRASLDEARETLAIMWGASEEENVGFDQGVWRLSQLHLCVEVANFAPEAADLERIVTHARKKAIHIPSIDEATLLTGGGLEDYITDVPDEWSDLSTAFFVSDMSTGSDHPMLAGEYSDDGPPRDAVADTGDEAPVDEGGTAVYLWGRRASGFAFVPGAPFSAAIHDKALEGRHSSKRWMEVIHTAGGWRAEMPLFRVEGRFTRKVFRGMAAGTHLSSDGWCDDPWLALNHLNDFWGYFVGLSPEHDRAPDATYSGWLRLTLPQVDRNRARRPRDPVWGIIQRAKFTDHKPLPLQRGKRVAHDLEQTLSPRTAAWRRSHGGIALAGASSAAPSLMAPSPAS